MKTTINGIVKLEDLKLAKQIQRGMIVDGEGKMNHKEHEAGIIECLQSLCYSVIKIEKAEVTYNNGLTRKNGFYGVEYGCINLTLWVTAILEVKKNEFCRISFDLVDVVITQNGWDDVSHYKHEKWE